MLIVFPLCECNLLHLLQQVPPPRASAPVPALASLLPQHKNSGRRVDERELRSIMYAQRQRLLHRAQNLNSRLHAA